MEFLINNLVIERWGTERGGREGGEGEAPLLSEEPKANPSSFHLGLGFGVLNLRSSYLWPAHGEALVF